MMLSEKLIEALESIQNSICLEPEKKLAYAVADDFVLRNQCTCGGSDRYNCPCSGTCGGMIIRVEN